MRETECNTAKSPASQPFAEGLKRIPDPRQRRGQRYAWETLLLVICAALVSGQQTGAAIAQWIAEHAVEWQAWTPTTAGRVPSAATVRRALRLVDAAALEQALGAWVSGCLRERETKRHAPAPWHPELRAVALDGKAVRGAQTHGAKVHLVSLVTHTSALTLTQCMVEAKSNEIPAAQRLLAGRDLLTCTAGWSRSTPCTRNARRQNSLCAKEATI
jgi:DDE family transposase